MKELETIVHVTKLSIPCRIGTQRNERSSPQALHLDITVELRDPTIESDTLRAIVNYAQIIRIATEVAASRERRLLETLTEDISRALFKAYPQLARVSITCVKPHKFASCESAGVTRTFAQ